MGWVEDYLAARPDIAEAIAISGENPADVVNWHWNTYGQNEGMFAPSDLAVSGAASGQVLTQDQLNQLIARRYTGFEQPGTVAQWNLSSDPTIEAALARRNVDDSPMMSSLAPSYVLPNADGSYGVYSIQQNPDGTFSLQSGGIAGTPEQINQQIQTISNAQDASFNRDALLAAAITGGAYLANGAGLFGGAGTGIADTTGMDLMVTGGADSGAGLLGATGGAVGGAAGTAGGAATGASTGAGSALGSAAGAAGAGSLSGLFGLQSGGLGGALVGAGANLIGGALQNQTNRDIANQNADLIRQANEDKRFRPVGVTTRFGQSQFGYDQNGRLTSAGYTLSPELKAMQDRQMGMLPQLQTDYERAAALGRGAMKTPQEFIAEQQGLLQPERERALAEIRNRAQQTGRGGLATMGTSTTMATNPELAAYYNAIQQENARLAANAPQQSLALASQGLGLMSEGYRPFATALGGAQNMETLGQGAMDIGTQLGAQASTAGARLQTPQMPNQVNPWAAGLMGGVNAYQQYQARQPVTTQNPYVPQQSQVSTMWDPANTPVTPYTGETITWGW